MYRPDPFNENNPEKLIAFCREQAFGTVISNGDSGVPVITHVPFVVKEDVNQLMIEFHIALANPQAQLLLNNGKAGISVMGTHGYISSSVYHHMNVPTYNYQSVYLSGKTVRLNQDEFLIHLKELVQGFEEGREKPLPFTHFPEKMIQGYLREIVGIRLIVDHMEGAYKLSQNRNQKDFDSIIEDLNQQEQADLAATMKTNYPKHDQ